MMKFEIKKRWTDEIAFTAEIDADELAPVGVKTALAIKWAVAAGISITGLALDLRGGTVTDCTVHYCTVTDCTVTGGKVTGGTVTDCTVTGGKVNYCTVTDCTVTGCTVTDCTVTGGTVTGGTVNYCMVTDCTVNYCTVTDCTVTGGTVNYCTVTGGRVTGGTVNYCTVNYCMVNYCTVNYCTITDCTVNYCTVPIIPLIHGRVLEAAQVDNAFDMGSWGPEHYEPQCETSRCRAGHVVNLAGEAGYALKDICGWQGAAWLIYKASDPTIERVPDFFASDDDAMADMKRLAELEAARNGGE